MTSTPTEVLRQYLDAVQNLDAAGIVALLADDAVVQMVLMPGEASAPISGKAILEPVFHQFFGAFKSYGWEFTEIHASDDPELAIARAASKGILKNGNEYRNNFTIFLRVRDGKVVESLEYFSPIAAGAIFAQ